MAMDQKIVAGAGRLGYGVILFSHYVRSMHSKLPCGEEADFWAVQLDCNWTDKTADFVTNSANSTYTTKPDI